MRTHTRRRYTYGPTAPASLSRNGSRPVTPSRRPVHQAPGRSESAGQAADYVHTVPTSRHLPWSHPRPAFNSEALTAAITVLSRAVRAGLRGRRSAAGQAHAGGVLVALGTLLFFAGAVLLAVSASPDGRYVTQVLPGWVVIGVGSGLAFA
ncbi:hypothetical protein GCM10023088_16370 [Actinomadura verrucosospora]